MTKHYVTSAFLQAETDQVHSVFGWSQRERLPVTAKSWLYLLEIFIHESSVEQAYAIFQAIQSEPIAEPVVQAVEQAEASLGKSQLLYLADRTLNILGKGFKSFIDKDLTIELADLSRSRPQVLAYLFRAQKLDDDLSAINSLETFTEQVLALEQLGLLTPAIGAINWGDLKRTVPICHVTGCTRGTPIDRYYQAKFVETIRNQVTGDVLEIGGVPKDREYYQFDQVQSYRILNIEAGVGVDLVGDVHDVTVVPPESVDTIVIFNVLEHCYAPWIAVENMRTWLKPGGKCFCLVPSAQRLHDRPGDFWRPLPDGVNWLFHQFSERQLYVYGNPMAVVASFHGIAVEEMAPADLDAFHPDYPVVTCIAAQK